jgi:predicted PhzF superfamily epimerase YddE/YHI9
MPQRIVQVDAFADRPFAGNPAAVCILNGPKDVSWMQDVALEMNLSETAFLVREAEGFHLRWFTPTVEVDLCGHATLASAHVLWEDGHLPPGANARFRTRSGWLSASESGGWITLDFPTNPVDRGCDPGPVARALGVPVVAAGMSRFDLLAEVETEAVVRSLRPDFTSLGAMSARGVIVTARAESAGFDFVSRFFAPKVGVPEDPVTGSAHCTLGPYWAAKLGRSELVGYQASSRGGVVRVRVEGGRALLAGQAVTVLRGELIDAPPRP